MSDIGIKPALPETANEINKHLVEAIGLANMLERRLNRINSGDSESKQIICQIREAVVTAVVKLESNRFAT